MSDDLNIIETNTEDNIISGSNTNNNTNSTVGAKAFIALIIALVVLAALLSFSFYQGYKLKGEVIALTSEVNTLKSKNIDSVISSVNEIKESQESLKSSAISNYMNHYIGESRLVTDDFVVFRAFCNYTVEDCTLVSEIDLSTQPAFGLKYSGQGRFSINDRELKNSLNEAVKKIEDAQKKVVDASNQIITKNTIYFSIQNYELATYENGVLKLKGE